MPAKRSYQTIRCADCGREAKAPNKLTRYCSACRLGRGAQWHDGRLTTCACGREYVAWNGKRTQPRCGRCFEAAAPQGQRESVTGTCGVCRQEKVLHSDPIRICFACLDLPEKRPAIRDYINRKYQQLQTAAAAATVKSGGDPAAEEQEGP